MKLNRIKTILNKANKQINISLPKKILFKSDSGRKVPKFIDIEVTRFYDD